MPVPEALLALVRVLPEATLVLSGRGAIVAANAPARDALALADEQPEGVALADLATDPPERVGAYLKACARSTALLPGAFTTQRRAAAPVTYVCRGARLALDGPALVLLRFQARDAAGDAFVLLGQQVAALREEVKRRCAAEDALRRSEAALRERARDAESASRIKDEFLAALSHELRTPLSAVLGWVTLLRQGRIPEDRRARALEVIERNARVQAQLIEELLDVSRIITGRLRLSVRQLDPIHVVEAALDAVRPAAEARGIRLHATLDPQAGPIMGDPDRLQQVVWNLLDNAVKFTPKGGAVQVLLERVASSVGLTVRDTGQGIDPEFLPHVFERFRQQESGLHRPHGGLGLGLSIAKSLVEQHGGAIRVESEGAGRGATFVVRLPRASVRAEPAPRPFASPVLALPGDKPCPTAIDGLRVVVVDDEADARDLLVAILEQCGATVEAARSAAEAYALVQATLPDVIISDVGMPGEDGLAFIQRVRALPPSRGGRTPAVALTAYARSEDRTQALTAGFHAHVSKPVELSELLAVVASLVGRLSIPS